MVKKNKSDSAKYLIIGNKLDLKSSEEAGTHARSLAQQEGIQYMEISTVGSDLGPILSKMGELLLGTKEEEGAK